MRPRTARLWRIMAPVALALAAIGVTGISAAASPTRGGTALVLPSDSGLPSATSVPTDPEPSPTVCTECDECDLVAPSPTSTVEDPVRLARKHTGMKLARFAAAPAPPPRVITATFSFTIDAANDPGDVTTTVDPDRERGGFHGIDAFRNSRNCYVLSFENPFVKCERPTITLTPNIGVRGGLDVEWIREREGNYYYHQYQFRNAGNAGQLLANGTSVVITFMCYYA